MGAEMRRPGYRDAVRWIALNDDTSWLADEAPIISVTACLVADLFDVDQERLIDDLRRDVARLAR